jgi:uncharacterized protein YaaR (DUF327 family)
VKINPVDSQRIPNDPKFSGRTGEAVNCQSEFDTVLNNSVGDDRRQICTALLKKIDEQSVKLQKNPSVEGIKHYRKLVGEFLDEALGHSYSVETDTKWDRGGNRREFIIVKKVNQSLEDLLEAVVNQEKKQFDLVAKLDEIRGLLVDLYC